MNFEEKNNKSVKRLLKELGLWGAWRKGRAEYVSRCKEVNPLINNIPQCTAFSDVISNSFVWAEQLNSVIWSKLSEMTQHLSIAFYGPSSAEIIENEELLNSVKDFVKTELNGTK